MRNTNGATRRAALFAAAALLLCQGAAQVVSRSCSCLRGKCTCGEADLRGPGAVDTSALSEAGGTRLTASRLDGTPRRVPGLEGQSLGLSRGSADTDPQGRILERRVTDRRLPLVGQRRGPPRPAFDMEQDLALMVDSVLLTEEGLLPGRAQRTKKLRPDHQEHKELRKQLTKDALSESRAHQERPLTEEGLLPSKAQRTQKVRAALLDHQEHQALSRLTKDALSESRAHQGRPLAEEGLLPSTAQRTQKVRAALLDHQEHQALSRLTKDALSGLKSR